jgi:Uma2 family endonuclease
MAAIPLQREIYYPESDGKPMAETELHADVMVDLKHALQARYVGDPDVQVGGNLLLYYEEGNPRASVSPDVYVTRGIPKGRRDTYLLWEEGLPPCFVIEVTSKSTASEDLRRKKALYERLGIEEYFLFDPREEYLHPPLQGYRLVDGRYQPISAEGDGSLQSRTTGLVLRPEGTDLRLIDPVTGERLLGPMEEHGARRAAEERAQATEERNHALEAEIARLRRELGRD